jgi:hypothetical protein
MPNSTSFKFGISEAEFKALMEKIGLRRVRIRMQCTERYVQNQNSFAVNWEKISNIFHSFANMSLFGSVAGTWLFDERRWLDSKDFEDFKSLKSVRKSGFVLACIPSALKFPRRRATTIYNSAFLGCCHAARTPSSALSRT